MPSQFRPLAPRPVFYVEDHPVNVLLMQTIFGQRPGLQLVVATSGAQALSMAPGLDPVLLLLDLRLPDCHGARLLPRLREIAGYESAPAVAVTAEDDFQLAGSGFCELWPKPLSLSHLLERLDVLTAWPAAPDHLPPQARAPRAAPSWAFQPRPWQ